MPADRDPSPSASARLLRGFGRRAGLHAFGRWWMEELAPLVPRSTRSALRRRRMRPVLVFEGDAATLWQPVVRAGDIAMEPGARIALAGDPAANAGAGRVALDALPAGLRGPGAPPVLISLPARQMLRRTLALPAALEENLRQALAYDIDRHTPFKAEELYFDAAIVGRDSARGEIKVDLAAARRSIVDPAIQQVEAWGATVAGVVPDPPGIAATSRLNLLPEERRPPIGGWRRWQVWAPFALFLAIALVSMALPIWQKREYAIALNRAVDAARSQAAVSEGLRTQLDQLAGEYNFALARKFGFPPALQVLDEITKLLPDDTWLTQMEVKTSSRGKDLQRELLLRGESGNAGRLITLFEASKVFSQAAPRSPTTKIQPGPGEIFDLVAQLRPLPPPVPVTLASNAIPEPPTPAAPSPAGPTNPPALLPAAAPSGTAIRAAPANAPATSPTVPAAPPVPAPPAPTPLPAAAPPPPAGPAGSPAEPRKPR